MDQNDIQKTLIEELGLSDLPPEKQEQLIDKMTEVLLKRIFLETMERLDDQGKEEYEKMITAGTNPEEMEQFLTSRIKNYDEMIKKTVEDFKNEMKTDAV
jgi:septum formation inhibitor MinC